ncbi:hypothetical protein ACL02T_34715 [Pseudonocardia sp. RS010]|uniref:hypothetical protein n=1 Tax=Pseudonocardia sp. RS010 TaxID=3385979 RepID=UPI0039A2A03F
MPDKKRRTTAPTATSWRETFDKWINEPAIRSFALVVLGMVLGTAVLVAGFASGVIASIVATVLPNFTAKLIAGGVATLLSGVGCWALRRRKRQRAIQTAVDTAQPGDSRLSGCHLASS